MSPYVLILIVIPVIWIGFEIGLVVRDRRRGRGKTGIDKGSRNLNFLAIFGGIGLAACLNGVSRFFFPGGRTVTVFVIGIAVMMAGMALRYWAVFTLGAFFRTTVETHSGQKLVDRGPYALIRHPSYTGWLLICLGYGLALQNWLSLAAAFLLPLAALIFRIRIEETALLDFFGKDYAEYQQRTKRLIPRVW